MRRLTPYFLALTLMGCANPPIVEVGDGIYLLFKEDHAGIFGSMAKLKADVITEANAFARARGKVAVPISVREKPVGNSPGDWASFEYQFKLVDPASDAASRARLDENRTVLPVRPDVSVQSSQDVSADIHIKEGLGEDSDIYTELLKLDDLRKKGIITKSEFNELKRQLLEKHANEPN